LSNDVVKAEIKALRDSISADVAQNGPFGFIRLSHHGATNGQDKAMLKAWGGKLFGISTGSASTKHPTGPTLNALLALREDTAGIRWCRTDMNGQVTYRADGESLKLLKQRGRYSDATLPAERAGDSGPEEGTAPPARVGEVPAAQPAVRLESGGGGNVEVIVRLPNARTRVSFTVDVEPRGAGADPPLH
jgi:hypothetical protein